MIEFQFCFSRTILTCWGTFIAANFAISRVRFATGIEILVNIHDGFSFNSSSVELADETNSFRSKCGESRKTGFFFHSGRLVLAQSLV